MASHLSGLARDDLRAAELLQTGFGVELTRPEERLRQTFTASLEPAAERRGS